MARTPMPFRTPQLPWPTTGRYHKQLNLKQFSPLIAVDANRTTNKLTRSIGWQKHIGRRLARPMLLRSRDVFERLIALSQSTSPSSQISRPVRRHLDAYAVDASRIRPRIVQLISWQKLDVLSSPVEGTRVSNDLPRCVPVPKP